MMRRCMRRKRSLGHGLGNNLLTIVKGKGKDEEVIEAYYEEAGVFQACFAGIVGECELPAVSGENL